MIYDTSKFPSEKFPAPDADVTAGGLEEKLKKLQKRIELLERKGFLEGVLVSIRASNTTGARQAFSNTTGSNQVRSHSMAFSDADGSRPTSTSRNISVMN